MRFFILVIMNMGLLWEGGILQEMKKRIKGKEGKELRIELSATFEKVMDQYELDLNLADTLFIIRGLDIQNGNTYGRIWNSKMMIHYFDEKIKGSHKYLRSNPKISFSENYTDNFDGLIKEIENNEIDSVIQYSNENRVFSGVYWSIISIQKDEEQKYKIDNFVISDFDVIKK